MRLRGGKRALIPLITFVACALLAAWAPQKPEERDEAEKEYPSQALRRPQELPAAAAGATSRLAFYVTPLSSKGLLTQQVKDALKNLRGQSGGAPVVHIRAFVAGAGDLRRVRDLVSESFAGDRRPLPSLSVVRAGGLPLAGAQVLMEAVVIARKDVNPNGLAFFSAKPVTSKGPQDPVPPLTTQALANLRQAFAATGASPSSALRVTCQFSSLTDLAASRAQIAAEYPTAARTYVQTSRAPSQALAACEVVARLNRHPGARLRFVNGQTSPADSESSDAALVASPRTLFTGMQLAFGYEEQDGLLALERIRGSLERVGASWKDVAYASFYPLSSRLSSQVFKLRAGAFQSAGSPAGSVLVWEGLPSLDAGFAVDLIAAID